VFPSVVGHRYAPRAAPSGGLGVGPLPDVGATIYLDTRVGKSGDPTGSASLSAALTAMGFLNPANNHGEGANVVHPLAFCPHFELAPAVAIQWTKWAGNSFPGDNTNSEQDAAWEKDGIAHAVADCYIRHQRWCGGTAGAASGAVDQSGSALTLAAPAGAFDWSSGHKVFVGFNKGGEGGPATSIGRFTLIGQHRDAGLVLHGCEAEIDAMPLDGGFCSGASGAGSIVDTSKSWTPNVFSVTNPSSLWIITGTGASWTTSYPITGNSATGITATGCPATDATSQYVITQNATQIWVQDVNGIPPIFDLMSYLNTDLPMTYYIKRESAWGAGDGQLIWYMGAVKIFNLTGIHTGALPLAFMTLQHGGPTWIVPPQDQTELFYNFLMWRGATIGA